MKTRTFILLIFSFTILTLWADEKLPALKVGDEVYSNVTVTAVSATDVYFTSDKGMANVKLKNLDPEMQDNFKFNAAKAAQTVAEAKKLTAEQKAAHDQNSGDHQIVDNRNAKGLMDDAMARVRVIVNQPVKAIPYTRDMNNVGSSGFWFHDGADKPDFNNVDVHATQDLQYAKYPYVTSDLNPGVVFIGSEVEFNSMTKYFYTDRTLPKKKLTEAEMVEINRLYRIIGKCEDVLYFSKNPRLGVATALEDFLTRHKKAIIIGVASVLFFLILIRWFVGGKSE